LSATALILASAFGLYLLNPPERVAEKKPLYWIDPMEPKVIRKRAI
jgi:hypothetical protein